MNRTIGGLIKKTLCLLCGAALLTGCGDGRQKKDDQNGIALNTKTLAAELSDRFDKEDYDLSIRILGSIDAAAAYRVVKSGSDGLVTMKRNKLYYEFYTINNETYMLLPDIECYKRSEELGGFATSFLKLGKNDMLYDIEETDSEITEVYRSSDASVKQTEYITFDKTTKDMTRWVTEEEGALAVVTEVDGIEWRTVPLEMPDLSSWSNISDGVGIPTSTSIKVSFYTRGITPEMVRQAGYTYEELAALDSDKVEEISRQLLE